jgi:ankyrin repeat protein
MLVPYLQDGQTPLHLAVGKGDTEVVSLLLEKKKGQVNVNAQDKVCYLLLYSYW